MLFEETAGEKVLVLFHPPSEDKALLSLCNRSHIFAICFHGFLQQTTRTLADKRPKSLRSVFCIFTWAHVYGCGATCALHTDPKICISWCNVYKLSLEGETWNEALFTWLFLFLLWTREWTRWTTAVSPHGLAFFFWQLVLTKFAVTRQILQDRYYFQDLVHRMECSPNHLDLFHIFIQSQ